MYISPSLLASALVLSFSTYTEARVAQHRANSQSGNALNRQPDDGGTPQKGPLHSLFGKRQDQDQDQDEDEDDELDCSTPDVYIDLLNDESDDAIQTFCNKWLGLPPATTEVDFTPTMSVTISGWSDIH